MFRFLLLWLFSQSSFCMVYAQEMVNQKILYEVNPKLDFRSLSEMTKKEIYFDSASHSNDMATLQALQTKGDTLNKVHRYVIDYYTDRINYPYRENRSRYFLKQIFNNNVITSKFSQTIDTITSECNCVLDDSVLKIKMGQWAFGGFGITIKVIDNHFESEYWEDTHRQLVYKKTQDQKHPTDAILLTNHFHKLTLNRQPNFDLGQNLQGCLEFKTPSYYTINLFAENKFSKLVSVQIEGKVYFKCKTRSKILGD